jgi:fatty acid-binding protein DegV
MSENELLKKSVNINNVEEQLNKLLLESYHTLLLISLSSDISHFCSNDSDVLRTRQLRLN